VFEGVCKPEARHIAIKRFELSGLHQEPVEDARAPVPRRGPIELCPGGQVRVPTRASETVEILERTPVLNQDRAVEVEGELAREQALLGMAVELDQHRLLLVVSASAAVRRPNVSRRWVC
jgi:hypothetical protein